MAGASQIAFPSGEHDHARCIEDAVEAAERICRDRGLRFTDTRRRVLEIVWDGHGPVGAYDILAVLQAERRRTAPPTVYRALDFLLEHGLVHKIETLNAFVGCSHPSGHPGGAHVSQFLICTGCHRAAEIDDPEIARLISRKMVGAGFDVSRQTVELQGVCSSCAARPEA